MICYATMNLGLPERKSGFCQRNADVHHELVLHSQRRMFLTGLRPDLHSLDMTIVSQ